MRKLITGLLHKNKKGKWGTWKEYYRNSTAVYWEPATDAQLELIQFYLTRTDIGLKRRKKYLDDYIYGLYEQQKRIPQNQLTIV